MGEYQIFVAHVVKFFMNVLWSPKNVGLDQDTSAACGSPMLGILVSQGILCKDDGPFDAVFDAWKNVGAKSLLEKLPQLANISDSVTNLFGRDLPEEFGGNFIYSSNSSWADYELANAYNPITFGPKTKPNTIMSDFGMVPDLPYAKFHPDTYGKHSVLVPRRFYNDKDPEAVAYAYQSRGGHLMGANIQFSSDGMDSLTKAYRESGYQYTSSLETTNKYRAKFLRLVHGNISMSGDYPGDLEYNHISGISLGPMKDNFEQPCNATKFTDGRRDCLSVAEATHGTKGMKWLEQVKKSVDPSGLFQCYTCTGFEAFDKGEMQLALDKWLQW